MLTEFFAITDLTTNPDPVLRRTTSSYVVWAPNTALSMYLLTTRAGTWWTARAVGLVFDRR